MHFCSQFGRNIKEGDKSKGKFTKSKKVYNIVNVKNTLLIKDMHAIAYSLDL